MRGATGRREGLRAGRLLCLGATAIVFAMASLHAPAPVQAGVFDQGRQLDDSRMVLEADSLTFDRNRNTVTATGRVRIAYQGNRLVADRVTYNQNTRRMTAVGNVEIVEKDGNIIHADQIDVTDDFAEGFVNALRVQTPQKTYFAAESAERKRPEVTTFNSGVYTACVPNPQRPERPPFWSVKSKRIVWDRKKKTIRFQHARFQMLGVPIAYLPVLEIPDPTVKRKSGFLVPGIDYDSELGFGVRIPYYFALSPTFDLTVSVSPYVRQGFLGEAEWRQQFDNGQYNLKIAGVIQQDPEAWSPSTVNGSATSRAMVGTRGRFEINPRWAFGWDILAQTDKNFSRTYNVSGFDESVHRSEIYLEGLNDRNYFDLRGMYFNVQEDYKNSSPNARQRKQPWVLPSFDYARTADEPVAGGELTFNVNAQALHRSELSEGTTTISDPDTGADITGDKVPGVEGSNGRLTAEAEWKRSFVTPGGLVLTPLLALRGDAIFTDYSMATNGAITGFMSDGNAVASDVRSAYWRYMATAGLEARWPILFTTPGSTHVLEPMAQLFIRPDAPYESTLGIPNEDAQSLVFDATTLFERDKFSGYDRIEGATRANVGLRYSGTFANGWTANAIFGQSYQLAGANPFAAPDLVNAGAYSGLESNVSDFVGLVGVSTPFGLSAAVGARLDEETLAVRRTDLRAAYANSRLSLGLQYAFIEKQPLYGFADDRREITGNGSLRIDDNWRVFGSSTYDLESETPTSSTVGFSFSCSQCFTYTMFYTRTESPTTREEKHSVGVRLSFRTLGDIGTSSNQLAE